MQLFAKYDTFEKSSDVEESWYDDEEFATGAKETTISPRPRRTQGPGAPRRGPLYDLIQSRPRRTTHPCGLRRIRALG
ncbi:unnamed protein product [Trichogramma brassicae]|uniref:Uncharacterized protein n=1 Tax=Trichogramma brassicae TaxID=86971 RepID=A0A6H5I1E3_9HYME|nr:unnamed protein product [Trichogramma brassicae]